MGALGYHHCLMAPHLLPPTSDWAGDPDAKPYFAWWADLTVDGFRLKLREADAEQRAYWMGVLLREANTRDVWYFVAPDEIRQAWPRLRRYLGRSRGMWAYLLDIEDLGWPPRGPGLEST